MQCPACKNELWIFRSRTAVEGDDSPDTVTKVFSVQEMMCTNPACSWYCTDGSKIVWENCHLIYEK